MERDAIPYYRRVLTEELAKRVETNSRYSLRRYSQLFGIAPGALSQILRGERSPSDRNVDRFFAKLELSEDQRREFLRSLLEEKRSSGKRRISRRLKSSLRGATGATAGREKGGAPIADLSLDRFRVISDWYHYAILEMVELPSFDPKPARIARRLGISAVEAKLAFERLRDLELVESADGKWRKTNVRIQTKDLTKTSDFHRRRQRQVIEKARESLDLVPWERRHHSAITIAVDPARIPEVRERIQKALWEIAVELERGSPAEVYEIALQVFPLERNPE